VSVDIGTAELARRMSGPQQGAELTAGVTLEARLGQLVEMLTRREQRANGRAQREAQSVVPIDLPPVDYTVTGGQPKHKAYRAGSTDASAQEGYYWFVQRLSLAGMSAGDVVNLHRPVSSTVIATMTAVHTFLCPAGVAAGLGVADWEPGSMGLIMRPDDSFFLQSAGTLTATELILTGQAIQVAAPYLAEYLL
jgi:hypothetical protein